MTSNTLSYADMPAEQLSRATSLGAVLLKLSVSFGVSVAATLRGVVTWQDLVLTPACFRAVFLMIAVIPLLGIPGLFRLCREDDAEVSQHRPGGEE